MKYTKLRGQNLHDIRIAMFVAILIVFVEFIGSIIQHYLIKWGFSQTVSNIIYYLSVLIILLYLFNKLFKDRSVK